MELAKPPEARLSDESLRQAINTVTVYHRGVNRPEWGKKVKYWPISLDFNGVTYVFHPEGVAFKRVRKQKQAEYLGTDGEVVVGSKITVEEWAPDPTRLIETGRNGVSVPVEAYRFWRSQGAMQRKIEERVLDEDGNATGQINVLLQTEVQIAQEIRIERDRLALERAQLAEQVLEMEVERGRTERELMRAREELAKAKQ